MKISKLKLSKKIILRTLLHIPFITTAVLSIFLGLFIYSEKINAKVEKSSFLSLLNDSKQEVFKIKQDDQYKRNEKLQAEITAINKNYNDAVISFEKISDLRINGAKVEKLEADYAQIVKHLADKNYASASGLITKLNTNIEEENKKIATSKSTNTSVASNVKTSNDLPGGGLSIQQVKTDSGTYKVAIIAADLKSTKVIIDTASESDCGSGCPVLGLADYANRNSAIAAINGNFFCPQDYPSCAGKKNSFDTLVMNKNKHYFNSNNNVYSTVPAMIFSNGSYRIVGRSLEWGRDTGVDGVIANYPQLLASGNISYSENPNEPKFGARGARNFVGGKDSTVYIGTIFNATMGEAAQVLKAMGMNDALNLDEGGSTALWYNGKYLVGPGRNIPNAVLFVKR